MKKNKFLWGTLALLLAFGTVLAACSKKDSGGAVSGGSSGGGGGSGKAAPASDFTYDLAEGGGGVVINRYTGDATKLVIPAEIEGLPVVELGGSAFYGENDTSYGPGYELTSVVIPASVKKIGRYCFYACSKLTSVTIQGTGVEICFEAFYGCSELTDLKFADGDKVIFPSEGILSGDVFQGCKKLPLAMRSKLKEMGFEYI